MTKAYVQKDRINIKSYVETDKESTGIFIHAFS